MPSFQFIDRFQNPRTFYMLRIIGIQKKKTIYTESRRILEIYQKRLDWRGV